MVDKKITARLRRKKSIRKKLTGTAGKPRLSVFRSNLHIYAQIIDDESGRTLASASSNSADVKELIAKAEDLAGKSGIAALVGEVLGKKAAEAELNTVVFDRNGYLYHGRVKALAEAVRKAGIKF